MAPLPSLLGLILAAAHAPADGHAEGAACEGGLPQLCIPSWPGQIFWLAVAFAVLYFTLSRSLLPKIGAVIEDRRDRIADDLDEAGRLQREAEASRLAYDKSLADARAKAHTIAGETRAKLAAELAEETKAHEAIFARKAAEADAKIKAATDQALANVRTVAGEAAAALVQKLAGSSASPQAVKSAVEAADRRS